MELVRRRSLNLLEEEHGLACHDELPLIPAKTDIQLYASRHDRPEPFFFAGSRDMLICVLRGRGRIEFMGTSVTHHRLEPGDYVSIPARTPHRVVPEPELLQLRYKASRPGHEALVWRCDGCRHELFRFEYDADSLVPHEQWLIACCQFNDEVGLRTCDSCGRPADEIDLGDYRWDDIAAALAAERR